MTLADLTDVIKMMIAGLPVIATLGFFHTQRSRRFDTIDSAHAKLEKKVDTLDADVSGLAGQLGGIVNDIQKRFLTREEHTEAVNRLDGNIVELNRTIGSLNAHLFDLARDRARGVGP